MSKCWGMNSNFICGRKRQMKGSCCPWQGKGSGSAVCTTKKPQKPPPYIAVSSEVRPLGHLQPKSRVDVGYRVRTPSSASSFTLQSKVSSWSWQAHSEVGHPVSVDIASVKLSYVCTGSAFLIICTHLCFLPWLDLTSLCEAEESHLFWWGFRVLASPLEGICGIGWVHNHECPGHKKQK